MTISGPPGFNTGYFFLLDLMIYFAKQINTTENITMTQNLDNKLVIAISSRALFNLDASHKVFEKDGLDAYAAYQIKHENDLLEPGSAFNLTQKLLNLHDPETNEPLVEVILISRNSADTGLRIFNSIQHHQLSIIRASFTNGNSPFDYIHAFDADLFLSANAEDVKQALDAHCAAAVILPNKNQHTDIGEIRIAFDGDAVVFSDESEKIYQEQGLDAFAKNEIKNANKPLQAGPFARFLQALHNVQQRFPAENCPIRTGLVTARSAPAHERVIRTLRAWDIRIDEALFLGGLDKGKFLKAFRADFFFDDQRGHCDSANQHVPTGHVPHGIMNN